MVLGVCRRVLHDPHDAEDAFQATFLVLVRKAASILKRELLGNWLYGVAYHTARAARTAAGRRKAKEAKAVPRQPTSDVGMEQELQSLLDKELSRLPDKYRIPVILCDLHDMSRRQAARELGLPEGTLSSRLARARAILARRLSRRGLALTSSALAANLGQQANATPLPSSLVLTTVKAGTLVLARPAAATGVVSAQVVALSEGVLKAIFLSKLKIVTIALLAGTLLLVGVGTIASRGLRGEPQPSSASQAPQTDAKSLLGQALETARAIEDLPTRFRALISVASAQRETGDAAGARKTLGEALEVAGKFADGRPKVMALLRVVLAQKQAGDQDAMTQTLLQAERTVGAIKDRSEQVNALSDLVRHQAIVGDYEGGMRTLAGSGDLLLSALTQFALMLNVDDKPAAAKVLKQALALVPENSKRAIGEKIQTLSAIARAQVKAGDPDGALRTVAKLDDRWRHEGLVAVIRAQASIGDIDAALRNADAVVPNESKADALQAIALAQAKKGDRPGARKTLLAAREAADLVALELAKKPKGPGLESQRYMDNSKHATLCGRIALTQFMLGDSKEAAQAAAAIESDYEKAQALLDIGEAQITAGKQSEARTTLVAAARAAQNVKTVEFRAGPGESVVGRPESAKAAALRQIAWQQAKAGDSEEALRTADSISTQQERDTALREVAPAQAAAGHTNEALETLARIKNDDYKLYALQRIVQARMGAGDDPGALAVVASQTPPSLKVHALVGAALGKAKQKAPEK
jgi:RNA polymerase sigma factor (sigma-70 family)